MGAPEAKGNLLGPDPRPVPKYSSDPTGAIESHKSANTWPETETTLQRSTLTFGPAKEHGVQSEVGCFNT